MTTLTPMTEPDYLAFIEKAIPAYAADKVDSGAWAAAESPALSKQAFDTLLPNGLKTPDNHLFTIRDAEQRSVGSLWIAVQPRAGQRIAFVFDVAIEPAHQRKGHAARAFLALESQIAAWGLAGIALHVFGHNTPGRALYAKLGYEPTDLSLYKPVGRAAGAPLERPSRRINNAA